MKTVSMKKLIQRDVAFEPLENPHRLVTVLDLENFRKKLVNDLEHVIEGHLNTTTKRWLRSYEVRKMLNISPGTLQHLKANGTLPFSQIGSTHYFDLQKIEEILTSK
jgi:hypothetical protein